MSELRIPRFPNRSERARKSDVSHYIPIPLRISAAPGVDGMRRVVKRGPPDRHFDLAVPFTASNRSPSKPYRRLTIELVLRYS